MNVTVSSTIINTVAAGDSTKKHCEETTSIVAKAKANVSLKKPGTKVCVKMTWQRKYYDWAAEYGEAINWNTCNSMARRVFAKLLLWTEACPWCLLIEYD